MAKATIREGLKLLRKPDFARLFFSYLVTFSGSAMAPIALAFGVLELTGSTRDSSIVIAAPIVAQIAVLLLGGTLADRTSRKRVMVFAETLAAVSQFIIATLFLTGLATVPLLAGLMLINGTAIALFMPAATGFITQVVDRSELQAANSLLGAARSSAFMGGAALAGVLVALFGAGITIALDALTFLMSALFLIFIKGTVQAQTAEASIFEDLRLGWREFVSHQWLWTIVLQFSIMVAAFEAVYGLLGPAIAKFRMNGAVDWGIIAAMSGLGTVVGGIAAMRLNVTRPMFFASFCCFFFAGTALTLAFEASVEVVALGSFIGGVAGQLFAVLWYTTLQTEVPANMLSRVSAYDHLGSMALAPVGVIVGGILFESIGATRTMYVAVGAVVIPTIMVLFVPGVRNLRTREASYSPDKS